MKKELVGILICTLFIATAIFPATGTFIEENIVLEEPHILEINDELSWLPISQSHPIQVNAMQTKQEEQIIQIERAYPLNSGSTEVVSTESDGDSQASSIAVDFEGTVHVVWCDTAEYEEAADGGLYDIFYKFKPEGGEWSATEVVTTESSIYEFVNPSMDVDSYGNVHVAWWVKANYDNYHHIFYRMKPKNGEWTSVEIILTDTLANCESYLTVDLEDAVHVVWMGMESSSSDEVDIYYNNKPYKGVWSVTELVSTESDGVCYWPAIAAGPDGTIHVVWSDDTDYQGCGSDYDTFYKMKSEEGSWTSTDVVSTYSLMHCGLPHIAIGPDGSVHVSWAETVIVGTVVFYRMKTSNGNWLIKEKISEICGAYIPWLAVDESGTVHFVFDDMFSEAYGPNFYGPTIVYRRKLDGGSWSRVEVISLESMVANDFGGAVPRIVVENNNLHFVWTDGTNYLGCGEDMDIFYKMKTIADNQRPNKPTINGPRSAKDSTYVDYTVSTDDADGDDVYYCLWYNRNSGEPGWFSTWVGPFDSGEMQTVSVHFLFFLIPGICTIKARAVDVNGGLSDIATFKVFVSKDKVVVSQSQPSSQQSMTSESSVFLQNTGMISNIVFKVQNFDMLFSPLI